LELVGNRHALGRDQRHILHRGIFSPLESGIRRAKLVSFQELRGNSIALDGYNVIVTLESALMGRPLLIADDRVVRDIAGISSGHRVDEITGQAMNQVAETLREARVERVTALFLSSMSKSGELAFEFGRLLKDMGLDACSRTERAVEKMLPRLGGIVVTASSTIIDRSQKVFDLAGFIIVERMNRKIPHL
jgi:hypothetical protein